MPFSADADGPPVGAVRLLRESLPLAAVTLSWVVVSWIANDPLVGTGARYAGVVMAGAYAVARGTALSRESTGSDPPPSDVPDGRFAGSAWLLVARLVPPPLLYGNLVAVLAGGAWLLAARLVRLLGTAWDGLGLPGLFVSPAPGLAFALTATGVLTVLLAAVAVALPQIRAPESPEGGSVPTAD
jgi:hypothetical protein